MKELKQDYDLYSEEAKRLCKKFGFFIIISSESHSIYDILPLYYTRKIVEEIFDVSKTNTGLLSLGCHSEETFRGYLFIHFLSTVCYLTARKKFCNQKKYSIGQALFSLQYLFAKVYNDKLLVSEPKKKVKDIMALINLTIPDEILL
jgi:transposase